MHRHDAVLGILGWHAKARREAMALSAILLGSRSSNGNPDC
jgi:hypothetical protein